MAHQNWIIPPFRFGVINEALYRGSYPTLRSFRHLSRLRLTTIISLTPETPSHDLVTFSKAAGIKLYHFQINRNCPLGTNLLNYLSLAVNIAIEFKNNPAVFVHCLDGRRITSLFVLLIRRLQGWSPLSAFTEYWSYQTAMHCHISASEIEKSSKDIEKFICDLAELIIIPEYIPRWLWGGNKSKNISGLKLKYATTHDSNVHQSINTDSNTSESYHQTAFKNNVNKETSSLHRNVNLSLDSLSVDLPSNNLTMTTNQSISIHLQAMALHGLDLPSDRKQRQLISQHKQITL